MPDINEGKCISCGLLSKRTAPDYSGLKYYEVRLEERKSGDLFSFPGPSRPLIRCSPCCYAGAASLAQEVMGEVPESSADGRWSDQQDKWRRNCFEVLSKDRKCPSWVEYIEGLSPQWHLEAHQMNLLQKAREEWELHMERDKREWEVQMEKDRREWHKEFQDQTSRFSNRIAVIAAVFALLQVIGPGIPSLLRFLLSCFFATGPNTNLP